MNGCAAIAFTRQRLVPHRGCGSTVPGYRFRTRFDVAVEVAAPVRTASSDTGGAKHAGMNVGSMRAMKVGDADGR